MPSAPAPRSDRLADLLCMSHLRWSFVFQRPQHLMQRFAAERRVFFFEEMSVQPGPPGLQVRRSDEGVVVATPHAPEGTAPEVALALQREALDRLVREHGLRRFVSWYYTPMALPFSRHLRPLATVYDCMDELSGFAGAPEGLILLERELMHRADVVMTGGYNLYEAKRLLHHNVHPFPSSVDVQHFARARRDIEDPEDQASIPHPRLGYAGVVDERMDLELLRAVAAARPDWHLVFVGPVVKIDPSTLPAAPNVHWLGGKSYAELPDYMAGWDVALMPFARNDATRFISPTKTPEYLAAGRPVVSTSIRDVVRSWGEPGFVRIADAPDDFVGAVQACLEEDWTARLPQVDAVLANMSWDRTWSRMREHVEAVVRERTARLAAAPARPPFLPARSATAEHGWDQPAR
jgi:UDP-galactopyranose mutase